MFKFILLAGVVGFLTYQNTTMQDFKIEAKRIIDEEQSTLRASWSAVTKVTGLNAVAKATGLGNYELCRKNLYLLSLYRVRNTQLLSDSEPVAVGVGAVKNVWIAHSNVDPSQQPALFKQLAGLTSGMNFTECETVHNPGEF